MTVTVSEKLLPYDDGSGHRFEIDVTKHEEGRVTISITSCGDRIEVSSAEWPSVSGAIDRALDFVAATPSPGGAS